MPNQTTNHLLLIRPTNFGYNEETAHNNAFQSKPQASPAQIQEQALQEFDQLVALLQSKDIQVTVIQDSATPVKPDAIFPNNWISFHANGTLVTYPMWSKNRRLERQASIVEQMKQQFGFQEVLALEDWEEQQLFLEGTGSMILDREHKICYACTSPRTDEQVLNQFCEVMGYQKVLFQSVDAQGQEIYHTNVMMALGEDFVVICLDSVPDAGQKQQLLQSFQQTGKTVVEISLEQVKAFAGNMLQVHNEQGDRFLLLSQQAYESLTPAQMTTLEQYTNLLYSPIPTIETLGGGSVRCMLAEVFMPSAE